MSKNTTGLPRTTDYVLGRGILYLGLINAATGKPDTGWIDVGNSPDFKYTVASTTLQHTSSRTGFAIVDKEVTTSQTLTLSWSLEEVNDFNLGTFLSGTLASFTNGAVAGFSAWSMIASGKLVLGNWYDLISSAGVRAYDVDASGVTVANGATTFVQGTDYVVDTTMGRIQFVSTSTNAAAAITTPAAITVTLSAKAGAKNVDEVRGLTVTSITAAVKFIADNLANNDKLQEYTVHQVSISADGDYSLIGTDWTKLSFKGTAQANVLASPTSPTITIRSLAGA